MIFVNITMVPQQLRPRSTSNLVIYLVAVFRNIHCQLKRGHLRWEHLVAYVSVSDTVTHLETQSSVSISSVSNWLQSSSLRCAARLFNGVQHDANTLHISLRLLWIVSQETSLGNGKREKLCWNLDPTILTWITYIRRLFADADNSCAFV